MVISSSSELGKMRSMLQGMAMVREDEGLSVGARVDQRRRVENRAVLHLLDVRQGVLRPLLGAETVR